MKIKINRQRNAGLALCAAIIIGVLIIAIGGMLCIVLIKACKCIKPKDTNDTDTVSLTLTNTMQPPARKFITPSITVPTSWIQVQRSLDLSSPTNWVCIGYMALGTNNGQIIITNYDTSGNVINTVECPVGPYVTNEVWDLAPVWPNNFYRAAQ